MPQIWLLLNVSFKETEGMLIMQQFTISLNEELYLKLYDFESMHNNELNSPQPQHFNFLAILLIFASIIMQIFLIIYHWFLDSCEFEFWANKHDFSSSSSFTEHMLCVEWGWNGNVIIQQQCPNITGTVNVKCNNDCVTQLFMTSPHTNYTSLCRVSEKCSLCVVAGLGTTERKLC